jgi:hypothetical protein
LAAAVLVFGSASILGACSTGTVADMWPHWAGGEPAGVPPRPGQPGYEEFIAHGQASQNPAAAPGAAQPASGGAAVPVAQQKSARQLPQRPPAYAEPRPPEDSEAQPAEAEEHPVSDTGVVRGGLY